ncbi:terminase family protein [Mesorhizobium sp. CA16]|uniref:phage terminase large subunit family protein n=1 Tax=Mesorhizobium sp. CA16 TaxID=588496 RepID=UPI001CCF55CA|nr:terminase family protein [Mesorhizobium sp. CA16]MBZ9912677.1 terminase family protein [Mesorhizobium sp. CA16]
MSRHVTFMTIDDAGHYSPGQRAEIVAAFPEHEREARAKGIPVLGSGRIFPVAEETIACEPFKLPRWWPRIGALDFGWDHPSAAVELAWDTEADVVYVTKAHRASQQTPAMQALALKGWGDWLPFAWPRDGRRETLEGAGVALAKQYAAHGLNMLTSHARFADGSVSVEAGLMEMLDRMQSGRFKVFSTLHAWFEEFRLFHRKNGQVVKLRDDLMAATRYRKLTLAYVSGAGTLPTSTDGIWLIFTRAGDKGADGTGVGDFTGPASSVTDNIVTFAGTTGKAGKDSGVAVGSLVAGPASAAADNIATFNGTTGKLVKDSGVAVASLAPKASPALTGTPTAPTATAGTNSTQIATTAYVDVTFAPKASPAFTGNPTAPTQAAGNNSTRLATTAYVDGSFAPLASPTFTGVPVLTGGGIKFPVTQVPSADPNTQDDYEEGTFTPAYSATGCTFSYTNQNGFYTKVGNVCWFSAELDLATSGNTLAANAISIAGLPFASSPTAPNGMRFVCAWFNSTTSYVTVLANLVAAASALALQAITAASTSNNTAALANGLCHATLGMGLRVCGVYRTA